MDLKATKNNNEIINESDKLPTNTKAISSNTTHNTIKSINIEVDSTIIKKKKNILTREVSVEISESMKYTFCKHVGMLGLGVIFFQLSICGWYIYIIFGYTRFQNFDREWIWLFIVMAILFFVSTIVCILIWKTFAKKYSNANIKEKNNTNDNNNDQSSETEENNGSCSGVFTYVYDIYYNVHMKYLQK